MKHLKVVGGGDPQATCFRKLGNYNEKGLQSHLIVGFPFSSQGQFNIDITQSISNILSEILGAEKGTARTPYYALYGGNVLPGEV